jgi:hypothetical protein
MNRKQCAVCVVFMLLISTSIPITRGLADAADPATTLTIEESAILDALENPPPAGGLTVTERTILAALDEGKSFEDDGPDSSDLRPAESIRRLGDAQLQITGFVDLGFIVPSVLADEHKDLDHHYNEAGNAQSTLGKLEARTFSINEVDFNFNVTYNDRIRGKASVFIYPTVRTNYLPELSAVTRDQDIPRDAGPDGKFGTVDDIIGKDTAVDFGDGLNRVVVGVKEAYLDLAYPGNLNAFLRIGKMPSLLGIEQELLESPHLPTVGPSAIGVFSYGYPQGVQFRGVLLDSELEFGVGLTHDPNNFGNIYPGDETRNSPFGLADDNFALAGRLAFSHGARRRFTVGVSGQFGEKGAAGSVTDGGFSSIHPFIKQRFDPFKNPNIGPFQIRAEGLLMNIKNRRGTHPNLSSRATEKYDFLFTPKNDASLGKDDRDGDDVEHIGFYVYLSVDLVKRLTLTGGYSYLDSDVIGSKNPALFTPEGRFLEWGARRIQFAARYKLHNDVVFKAEFQINDEKGNETVIDNDVLTTSLVYSF